MRIQWSYKDFPFWHSALQMRVEFRGIYLQLNFHVLFDISGKFLSPYIFQVNQMNSKKSNINEMNNQIRQQ